MAAITCMYSATTPAPPSWKDAAEEKEEQAAVANNEPRNRSTMVTRRTCKEGGEGEVGGEREVEKWEGKVRREIEAGPEEVWEMVGKFTEMKRWNANVEVCEVVEGEEGKAGCVRYCTGKGRAADGTPHPWVKEKLLAMYPDHRRFTYTIIDSSYGFQGYEASLSILPLFPSRSLALWTFQLDPVPQTSQHHLLTFLSSIFDRMTA